MDIKEALYVSVSVFLRPIIAGQMVGLGGLFWTQEEKMQKS